MMELKYYMFDWDDNILHMPTQIHLEKRTDHGWEPTSVTTAEFAHIRNDKENYRPPQGDWDNAFSEFHDEGHRGADAFLDDTQKALKPIIEGIDNGAPSFHKFRKALIDGRIFAIITARAHHSSAIRKSVEYFISSVLTDEERSTMLSNLRKFIAYFEEGREQLSNAAVLDRYLSMNKYRGVTSPEFQELMMIETPGSESPEHAKRLAIQEFVTHVLQMLDHHEEPLPTSIGFSDDDPNNIAAIESYLEEELSKVHPEIKFVVYDTSDPSGKNGRKIVLGDATPES